MNSTARRGSAIYPEEREQSSTPKPIVARASRAKKQTGNQPPTKTASRPSKPGGSTRQTNEITNQIIDTDIDQTSVYHDEEDYFTPPVTDDILEEERHEKETYTCTPEDDGNEADDYDADYQAPAYNSKQSGKLGPLPTRSIVVSPSKRHKKTFSDHFDLSTSGGKIRAILAGLVLLMCVWIITVLVITVLNFCTDQYNTYTYGPTRTASVQGVFGMNNDSFANPTSIIAVNDHGNILIIVDPAGNPSKAQTYTIGYHLIGDNVSKAPATVTIKDINHDHRQDFIVTVNGTSIDFLNTGNTFKLTTTNAQ